MSEAMFAIARYQIEDPSFHPFTSKYDAWLQGKARFTPAEARGYLAFNDPTKGNCAACHLDKPTQDGLPPLFTDFQYEALGVPRNAAIPANQRSRLFRSRHLRSLPHGYARPDAILRHVPDAQPAQHARRGKSSSTMARSTRWTKCWTGM